MCRCVGNYTGPRCMEEVDDTLSHVEIGMFAGFAGLAVMFVILGVCVVIIMRIRSKQQNYFGDYQDQYQGQYQDQYQEKYQDQYQDKYQDQYQDKYQDQYRKQLYPYQHSGQLALKY